MPVFLLSTCGTSLLTGGKISDTLRQDLRLYANAPDWTAMPPDAAQRIKIHAANKRQELLEADDEQVRRLSAELNSFLSWKTSHQSSKQDYHLLLATDTAIGKEAAESIQMWLKSKGYVTELRVVDGLRTSSLKDFREALAELTKTLTESFESYRTSGYSIQFNLTGGFKSLNGFLQALSTIYADETFYLFEGSKELILIPKLPFSLNANEIIQENLKAFRRLNQGLPVKEADHQRIPSTLLFYIDNEVVLSEWGEFLWRTNYKEIYREKLLPSISDHITYGEVFEDSAKDLPRSLLEIINTRIVELAEYAENGCQHALNSLDPKPLQAGPHRNVNRWECDLDAHHRIFMIKEGHSFLLEKVDKAFH